MKVSLTEQIKCVKRELAFRRVVYEKKVRQNYMSQEEATREINAMQAVLTTLMMKHEGVTTADQLQVSGTLYQKCVDAYHQFLKNKIGVGAKMNGAQGKSMKDIIKYLRKESKDQTDAGVLNAWQFILNHWDRTGPFIGKQKTLTQINKNLIEIIDKIRNGHDKKTEATSKLQQLELGLERKIRDRADKGGTGA